MTVAGSWADMTLHWSPTERLVIISNQTSISIKDFVREKNPQQKKERATETFY
jgi:hypothetical protein